MTRQVKSFNPVPRPLTAWWLIGPTPGRPDTVVVRDQVIGVIVSAEVEGKHHVRDVVEPAVMFGDQIRTVREACGDKLLGIHEEGTVPAASTVAHVAARLGIAVPTSEHLSDKGIT